MLEEKTLKAFKDFRKLVMNKPAEGKPCLVICAGTGGLASGSNDIMRVLKRQIIERGLQDRISIRITGCLGFCEMDPFIITEPGNNLYPQLKMGDIPRIIDAALEGKVIEEMLYREPGATKKYSSQDEIPFFKGQTRTILGHNQHLDPIRLPDYIRMGGYAALEKVLANPDPARIIKEVRESELRGRGGAGFPTGRKWELARNSGDQSTQKFMVCNADEGDPGAYMDRSLLEGNPHSILEGLTIAGIAIGASKGIIYVRNEYPLAVKHSLIAIKQARDFGILGKDILGTGIDFDIEIVRGAGAFVCGEETALIRSIEGRMGEPRQRPPYPIEKGIFDHPTCINNVETLANIPEIIAKGANEYVKVGVPGNRGTKIFSLVGKIKNTGLVEVPLGTPLKKVVYDIGGGSMGKAKIKAVQTGGPSGGCIPASMFDLLIDYERLTEVGSMMGSGGMIVMDESTCMVDISRYFLEFLKDESCGKCFPCRMGVKRMLEILNRICAGQGLPGDIDLLQELGQVVKNFSLCGLGQTSANPVLSTLRYFKDEYEAHIKDKHCPAKVCKRLTPAPCQNACPAGIDVPSYIALIARKRYKESLELILEDNPFPSVCGRACTHSCEFECKRAEVDKPIAIKNLKRYVADLLPDRAGDIKPLPITKKEKVAVIGAGPGGLTAAYNLIRMGYAVTVFEALPAAGGMMVVGIPEYRLPRDVLQAEIQAIAALGVEIKLNTRIGKDITIDEIKQQGYGAIFISIGAHQGRRLGIPGEDQYKGFIDSIDFLRKVNLGDKTKPGDKVVVIGGGNSAVDAARSALRLGSSRVNIAYRRTRKEMPAASEEVDAAEEEGVNIHYLVSPKRVVGEGNRVTGLECIRTKLGAPDASGRRRPVPIEGSEFIIPCDVIIPAISQEPEISGLIKDIDLKTTAWNTFEVDPDTLETNIAGIFAGGDAVTGPATIIEAIAAGQRAAAAIDKYFNKEKLQWRFKSIRPKRLIKQIDAPDEEIEKLKREEMPCIKVVRRINNFDEVELGYTEEMCINEAKRCLRCDL